MQRLPLIHGEWIQVGQVLDPVEDAVPVRVAGKAGEGRICQLLFRKLFPRPIVETGKNLKEAARVCLHLVRFGRDHGHFKSSAGIGGPCERIGPARSRVLHFPINQEVHTRQFPGSGEDIRLHRDGLPFLKFIPEPR